MAVVKCQGSRTLLGIVAMASTLIAVIGRDLIVTPWNQILLVWRQRTWTMGGEPLFLLRFAYRRCYGPSVCVPPNFTYWISNPQWDGVRRRALWGSDGWALTSGIHALIVGHERDGFLLCSLSPHSACDNTERRPQALTDTRCVHPWSWTYQPPELEQ